MIYFICILVFVTAVYFVLIALVVFGFLKIKKSSGNVNHTNLINKISVIIAVRNEASSILNCLKSIENQNFEKNDFEVIIINDHSIDETEELISKYMLSSELNLQQYNLTDKTSKKEALNYGIENSNYDIIATTDADCVLPGNWLRYVSNNFNDSSEMLIGPIVFNSAAGFLSNFQTLDMLAIQGIEFGMLSYNKPVLNNAANLSYKKNSYLDVNGFDQFNTPSGDDVFLLEKFKKNNKKIKGLLSSGFVVETKPEFTVSGFINQRIRWSSKTKYYSDNLLVFISSIVLIQNILLPFIYFGIPLVEKYRIILIILLCCKWLIDFILLFLVSSFFKRRSALFYFIPVQLFYPVYIAVIWILSMTTIFEWKGRKF